MAVISGEVSEPCTLSSPTSGAHRLLTRLGASPPLHPFTGAAEICAHSFWYNRACGGRDLRQIKWESRREALVRVLCKTGADIRYPSIWMAVAGTVLRCSDMPCAMGLEGSCQSDGIRRICRGARRIG